jgi:rifampicin phosphotransferase
MNQTGSFADTGSRGTESYVVPLSGITERATVGSKAGDLAELGQAGFPVPDGFVVTTHAFAHFLGANGLEADATPDDVQAAAVPADIKTSVEHAAATLGDGPFAVRSSGIAEDLPGFSFAGQYETVLNVGHDGLRDGLKAC